jgi:sulfite reductase beta subunit-like hemoprotein
MRRWWIAAAACAAACGGDAKRAAPSNRAPIDESVRRSSDALRDLEQFSDRVCACTSRACAAAVMDEAARYAETMARLTPHDLEEARYVDGHMNGCAAKLGAP